MKPLGVPQAYAAVYALLATLLACSDGTRVRGLPPKEELPYVETQSAPVKEDDACVEPAPACTDGLIDGFESDQVIDHWQAAEWAEVTLDDQGQPAYLESVEEGAAEGTRALRVPVRFAADGYRQGYVGRSLEASLEGCAGYAVDVTLPASAPVGIRAKVVLHLDRNWHEAESAVALEPGRTTTLWLGTAAAFASLPARGDYAKVTAIGVKVEGNDVRWVGHVLVDNVRRHAAWPKAAEDDAAFPVGVFGGFTRAAGPDIPEQNGFLTFVADAHAARHGLVWPKLESDGSDLRLVETRFGLVELTHSLRFIDWTTVEARAEVLEGIGTKTVTALMSRVMPAVRYDTEAEEVTFATAFGGRSAMAGLMFVSHGRVTAQALAADAVVSLETMSEPWMLLFPAAAAGWSFDAPVLVTFERKPAHARLSSDGLVVASEGGLGALQVMPFYGLTRKPAGTSISWLGGAVPGEVSNQARVLATILAAFPTSTRESFKLDGHEVAIEDRFDFAERPDAWGTAPRKVAILPPLTAAAQTRGYPVNTPQHLSSLDVATFHGPFLFADGDTLHYRLPRPAGLDRLELPVRVDNDDSTAPMREEALRLIRDVVPESPAAFFLDGDDRAASFLCEAMATLGENSAEREKATRVAAKLIEHNWLDSSLQLLTEPVTGQRYLNNAKYWASQEPFDKEWYTGRQLAALGLCSEQLSLDLARGIWPRALGLYRYNRIFFDWALGSTLSSVFGFTALIDGIFFAWEGMMSTARLARALGDDATADDATYRAARQQLAVYMLWHHAEWIKQIDYGIGHLSRAKLPAEQVETRGAVDGYVEDLGATTLQFESFWQTSNAIAFDVRPQFAFYRDFGIAPRLRELLYFTMPEYHPYWSDGNAWDNADKRYYGSQYAGFHLAARAAMFHADPEPLFRIYQQNDGSEASKQWYSMRWHGVAGPMMLDLARATAPSVELPTARATVTRLSYDRVNLRLNVSLKARVSGPASLRITWPDGTMSDESVTLCNGKTLDLVFSAPDL